MAHMGGTLKMVWVSEFTDGVCDMKFASVTVPSNILLSDYYEKEN